MNQIKCSVCGKTQQQNTNTYKKRVEKFGTTEEMLAKYKCRVCTKQAKTGTEQKPNEVKQNEPSNESNNGTDKVVETKESSVNP